MPKGRKMTPAGVVKESSAIIAEREKTRPGHEKFSEQPREKKSPVEEEPKPKSPKKRGQ